MSISITREDRGMSAAKEDFKRVYNIRKINGKHKTLVLKLCNLKTYCNSIYLPCSSVEDELVWDHSKDGQFSVKSAYWLKFYGKFGTGTSNVQGHFSMWGIKCGVWVFLRNLNCLLEGRSLDFVCQRYIAQVENRGTPVLFSEWLTGWLKSAPNEEVVRGFCVIAFGYLVCTE
ncbi:uncharacterized protein LOC131325721 isoform X2 [Rhododendron vialii]|uniref:uncharacterized protein LOC131325721 isoform X2 n=1 Tax=Rhododendron vialii TaxID=182163 RepID=UPI00265F2B3E|nr:uncharacterized protein LOC131325721 isoform X2 [Rhododendron vialii]XP_058214111.1 uncharacterized protein LOC131325721 isoform X2 [Rhododendron vialii]